MSEAGAPSKATPAVAFCFLANAVLSREKWARERLEPFAGQGFEVRPPLVAPFSISVAASGYLEPGDGPPAAVVTPGGISGDSAFAEELRYLRAHLRPDVEEELSRFLGDIAAQRLVGAARGFLRWQLDALTRIGEAAADYAVNERQILVRHAELADFAARVEELNRSIVRLEERL